ncbi:FGGY-family carbohydrate kinase [Limnochorda pilosa]|uniref:Carbohydrate kinase n=1 Tax=Limnochorda pilosa TaxID=1555112 RepID=A0A0K2SLM4_LIMPI|nr:FGGY family carbohydrate kinase [Limnochorda pilosa]BAS28026.1 hypothetical protein LIP_2185 [Limnochorda pilosa]
MAYLIGIDLGTTRIKAIVVDETGRQHRVVSAPTPSRDEGDGRVVYEGAALWSVIVRLIRELVSQIDPGQVAGVACASMGEAGFLVDDQGRELFPALAWFDPRTRPIAEELVARLGRETLRSITGLPADFTYSVSKLLWYREHDRARFQRARYWLNMADWVAFRLSGVAATDFSLASRTMAFDVRQEVWSSEILDECGLEASLLPTPVPGGTRVGRVTGPAARETGLPEDVSVCSGAHDQLASALAVGATRESRVLNSCGTAETILTALSADGFERALPHQEVVIGHHLFPSLFYGMTTLRTSGLSATWFVREMLTGTDPDYDELGRRAEQSEVGARGLRFFPYFRTSADVVGAPDAAMILGLRDFHTNADLARALLEGLSFEARRLLDRLQKGAGVAPKVVRAVGGSTANRCWMQLKADVMGLPLQVAAHQEGAGFGAALLAGLGSGLLTETDLNRLSEGSTRQFSIRAEEHAKYAGLYQHHLELLPLALEGARRAGRDERRGDVSPK